MPVARDDGWKLLTEYTTNPSLIRHALAVEAAMRAYAVELGGEVELWGLTGLVHDFDYDRFPDEHPGRGAAMLEGLGYPPELVHAVLAHSDATGVPRESLLDRALYAVDELCGFITAAALIRPDRSIRGLTVESVVKRMKDKAFARAVNRDELRHGAEALGVDFARHVGFVIAAMTEIADQLELSGR